MATDNGYPVSHSGSAMVRVSVTNVNDEDPVFMQSVEHILVSEDALPNTVIHVVQAYDPDGDDVTFSFTGMKPQVSLCLLTDMLSSSGLNCWISMCSECTPCFDTGTQTGVLRPDCSNDDTLVKFAP